MVILGARLTARRAAAAAGGSLMFALYPASQSPVVGLMGLAFLAAWTVVVPGWALSRLLGERGDDPVDSAALWILHGLFVALACAFVWALAGLSARGFGVLVGVATALLVLAAPARDPTRVASRPRMGRVDRFLLSSLAGLLVLLCTSVYVAGPPLDFGKDTLDYMAYVDEVSQTGEAFPVTEFYRDPGRDGADLRKALLHSLYGYYKARLGIDTVRLFAALAALMLAAAAILVHGGARRLLRNRAAGALSAILFLLCFDRGPASEMIRAWFYPSRFGLAVLLAVVAASVALYRRPTARRAVLCTLAAFTAAAVHVQYTLLSVVVVGVLAVWKTCAPRASWREHLRRTAPVAVAVISGILPFGVFRYVTAYQANELHAAVQGAVFVADGWFVVNPWYALRTAGLLPVAALLAIVPLWRVRRENPGVGFVTAASLTVLLVQYNPLVVTPLYGVITYLVYRLDQTAAYVLLPAFLLVALVGRMRGVRAGVAGGLAVAATALAVFIGVASMPAGLVWNAAARDAAARSTHLRWRSGLAQVDTLLPPGSVVASDPVTSYAITAFTRHYVVATLGQHAPPNDRLLARRTRAARDILSPFTSPATKVARAREFDVSHVVINENIPRGMTADIWTMDPAMAALSKRLLERWPGTFRGTNLADGLTVFELAADATPPRQGAEAPHLLGRMPASARRIGAVAGEGMLEGARIQGASVAAGDSIDVELYWSSSGERRPAKYLVSIRMDHADLSLPFGGRPFPKLSRKLKEAAVGRRYRARSDHMIAGGFMGPDVWPPGGVVRDAWRVPVPRDLAPGRYTLRAKLLEVANAVNHRLRDFFFDDDTHHGVEIGEIVVE